MSSPTLPVTPAVRALDDLRQKDAVRRLWARDHTLWQDDPTEVADRLGWLDVAGAMATQDERLLTFADALVADGIEHVVVMGMGEPMANYEALMDALRTLNADWGLNFGARRVTLSTSGVVPKILKLAEEPLGFRLAISLHGATDEVRVGTVVSLRYDGDDDDDVEQFLVGCLDTGIMAQNAFTALESLGLGGCFIGGIRNGITEVSALLRLPQNVFPVVGIAFGHPAVRNPVKPRLPATITFMENGYEEPAPAEQPAPQTGQVNP
jgi:hypothetical protein